MTTDKKNILKSIDWILVAIYMILAITGILNIYSSVYTEEHISIFSPATRSGMQIIWFGISLAAAAAILFIINPNVYDVMSWMFYGLIMLLLIAVLFIGDESKGSVSWIRIGPIRFQPAEISKITTSLLLASIMSRYGFRLNSIKDLLKILAVILLPVLIIIMQKETGTTLVYAGFIFVLYREGMSGWFIAFGMLVVTLFVITMKFSPFFGILAALAIFSYMWQKANRYSLKKSCILWSIVILSAFIPMLAEIPVIERINPLAPEYWMLAISVACMTAYGINPLRKRFDRRQYALVSAAFAASVMMVFSVDIFFHKILQPHQRERIESLLGLKEDIYGVGYNVHQSKIAIGSGGFFGKGYLNGTQTKYNFVPEQSTDFIFCTIGEEWGFAGSVALVALYIALIIRIVQAAEKSREKFTRVYGYCVASALFMHFLINIGMTIGILPVIGIPLPFVSYGGTSILAFTVMLFIFIRLDAKERG